MSTHKHTALGMDKYEERTPIYDHCECGATRKRFVDGDKWHVCRQCVEPKWHSELFPVSGTLLRILLYLILFYTLDGMLHKHKVEAVHWGTPPVDTFDQELRSVPSLTGVN